MSAAVVAPRLHLNSEADMMTHDEAPVLFHVAQQKSLDTGIPLGTLESRWGRTGIPLRSPRTAASATTSTSKEYKTGVSAGGGQKIHRFELVFLFPPSGSKQARTPNSGYNVELTIG